MVGGGRWLGFLVALMLSLAMVSAVGAAPTTYTDPQGRFSFTAPDGFRRGSPQTAFVSYESTSLTGVSFNVVIVPGEPSDATLTNIVVQSIPGLRRSFSGYQQGPATYTATTLAEQPAVLIESFISVEGTPAHVLQYALIYGSNFYVLTFGATTANYNTALAQTRIVRDSFTFLTGPQGDEVHRLGNG